MTRMRAIQTKIPSQCTEKNYTYNVCWKRCFNVTRIAQGRMITASFVHHSHIYFLRNRSMPFGSRSHYRYLQRAAVVNYIRRSSQRATFSTTAAGSVRRKERHQAVCCGIPLVGNHSTGIIRQSTGGRHQEFACARSPTSLCPAAYSEEPCLNWGKRPLLKSRVHSENNSVGYLYGVCANTLHGR